MAHLLGVGWFSMYQRTTPILAPPVEPSSLGLHRLRPQRFAWTLGSCAAWTRRRLTPFKRWTGSEIDFYGLVSLQVFAGQGLWRKRPPQIELGADIF